MSEYTSRNGLKNKRLKKDDTVTFTLKKGKILNYRVMSSFLSCEGHTNDVIFMGLGILNERKEIARIPYRYPAGNGDWPEYHENDYAAATRLCNTLYKIIEASDKKKKKERPTPRELNVMEVLY